MSPLLQREEKAARNKSKIFFITIKKVKDE
jgi:hypothetical protein